MVHYLLLVIGFLLLIRAAGLLLDGAASLGRSLGVSDLAIGLTVVAFGTSAPELFINIVASVRGNAEIAAANIIGSNIANVLLILGIAAVVCPLAVGKGTVRREIPFSLLAVLVLGVLVNDRLLDGVGASALTRGDGLVLLCFFAIFIYYSLSIARNIEGVGDHVRAVQRRLGRSVALIATGLAGLALGANWIVVGAAFAARQLGISESLIGLTVVALGTSLPELATSVVAAARRNFEVAVGNVVGSNIFNIFFILGVSSLIRPVPLPTWGNWDLGVVLLASFMLLAFMFTGQERSMDRWEGVVSIAVYVLYVAFSVGREFV